MSLNAEPTGQTHPELNAAEILIAQKELQSLKSKYIKAAEEGDHYDAADLSSRMVILLEKIQGPDSEQVGIQLLNTGSHYLKAWQAEESLPHLRRAVEIIPESNTSLQKTAYEYLLVALTMANRRERTAKLDKRSDEFVRNVRILACIILPPTAENRPSPIEEKTLEYPESVEKRNIGGWVIGKYAIDKKGRVKDPYFLSIWPKEFLQNHILEWLESRRYKPVKRNGRIVELENIPLVVTLILKDAGIRPHNMTYDTWMRRVEAKWEREQEEDTEHRSCKELMAEDYGS